MSFGDLFWPIFLALVAWTLTVEVFHTVLGMWAEKRQRDFLENVKDRVIGGEPLPPGFQFVDFHKFPQGGFPPGEGETTASGHHHHGQYM